MDKNKKTPINIEPQTTAALRTRSVQNTARLLVRLCDQQQTPGIPAWLREEAKQLLIHYPMSVHLAHCGKMLPSLFDEQEAMKSYRLNVKAHKQ